MAIILLLDYYAVRSDEYKYLIRFFNEENHRLHLDGLPSFCYSLALSHFRLSLIDEANEILQDALLRFPTVLKYLLDKLSIKPDRSVENCRYFSHSERSESDALKCVQQLYVYRMANEWKEKDELDFLRTNVAQVIEILQLNQDSRIEIYSKM